MAGNALNIYSTTAGPYLGWAYLPSILESPRRPTWTASSSTGSRLAGTSDRYEGQYDQGETLTHEVGHWLNLEHTFYKCCTETGDFVADTPAAEDPDLRLPEGKDTCRARTRPDPQLHGLLIRRCYSEFTPGQVTANDGRLAVLPGIAL